jgi:hypothetical protein
MDDMTPIGMPDSPQGGPREEKSGLDMNEWVNVWVKALTQPNENAYSQIAFSPNAQISTGLIWVAISAAIYTVLGGLIGLVFGDMTGNEMNELLRMVGMEQFIADDAQQAATTLGSIAIGLVVGIPFAIIVYAIVVGFMHLLAKLVGGKGDYGRMLYTSAAYSAPLTAITNSLSALPVIGGVFGLLNFYAIYLQALTIKTVYGLSWAKAILVMLIPTLFICLLMACLFFVMLSFGMAVGGVFDALQ